MIKIDVFPDRIDVGASPENNLKVIRFISTDQDVVMVYLPEDAVDHIIQALKGSNITVAKTVPGVQVA